MYMHHTPKELVLSLSVHVHALNPHRIGVLYQYTCGKEYHCIHHSTEPMVQYLKLCVGAGGLISFEQNE